MDSPLPRSLLRRATAIPNSPPVAYGLRVFEGPYALLRDPPTVVGVPILQAVAVEVVRGIAIVEGILMDAADTVASAVINGVTIGRRL